VERIVKEAKDEARQARQLAKLPPAERKTAERKAKSQRAARERRARELEEGRERRKAEDAERAAAATEAADMLRRHLGDELPRFLALMDKVAYWREVDLVLRPEEAIPVWK